MSEARLPDDALVVRGGLMTPESIQEAADLEPDGTFGLSVQSAPGMTPRDLAREGDLPHSKIRVSSVGRIRSLGPGFDVIPTAGPGRHGTLTIPSRPVSVDDAQKITGAFDEPIPNPARRPGERPHGGASAPDGR
ncbi:MAG: hypothetical protein ACRDJN_19985 [Chloroflexota bacterium]